ncbi:Gibberellin-regulated protein 4 [Spatholobus suberectus]|nr:Gibberellin-regulated protein 4 [Spatholobus suberectus]
MPPHSLYVTTPFSSLECSSFWCFNLHKFCHIVATMAVARLLFVLIVALIAISMLQTVVMASHGHGGHHYNDKKKFGAGSLKSYQCPSQCTRRCSKTQYHKPCMFFCQKCCKKCLCVPPGYYGNKAVCPCYNNWKTKRGGPKCP